MIGIVVEEETKQIPHQQRTLARNDKGFLCLGFELRARLWGG